MRDRRRSAESTPIAGVTSLQASVLLMTLARWLVPCKQPQRAYAINGELIYNADAHLSYSSRKYHMASMLTLSPKMMPKRLLARFCGGIRNTFLESEINRAAGTVATISGCHDVRCAVTWNCYSISPSMPSRQHRGGLLHGHAIFRRRHISMWLYGGYQWRPSRKSSALERRYLYSRSCAMAIEMMARNVIISYAAAILTISYTFRCCRRCVFIPIACSFIRGLSLCDMTWMIFIRWFHDIYDFGPSASPAWPWMSQRLERVIAGHGLPLGAAAFII